MFGIGVIELIAILILALLIFGPRKLPELGRALGAAIREFKEVKDDVKRSIEGQEPTTLLKKHNIDNKGFTLIEAVVVISIIAVLAASIISISSALRMHKIAKTEKEMESVLNAAEAYQWNTGSAPTGTSALSSGKYIQQGFTGSNPFDNQYTVSGNAATKTITVQTTISGSIDSLSLPLSKGGSSTITTSTPKKTDDVMRLSKRKALFYP